MRSYVTNILVPYFQKHKTRLSLPQSQCCIWFIDIWSVHRSDEFCSWLWEAYNWIILNYIPNGCTGLFQPADVGIQRPLKHAIRWSTHYHAIQKTIHALRSGVQAGNIQLDKRIGVLCDRSIEWLVNGYQAINKTELVQKVSGYYLPSRATLLTYLGMGNVPRWVILTLVRKLDKLGGLTGTQ